MPLAPAWPRLLSENELYALEHLIMHAEWDQPLDEEVYGFVRNVIWPKLDNEIKYERDGGVTFKLLNGNSKYFAP